MNPPTRRKLLMDAQLALAPIAGDMAKREGRWLLEAATGLHGAALLAGLDTVPLDVEMVAYRALVRRRVAGEPLQYVLGEAPFLRRMFRVGPGVLIPRPETEFLAERALGGLVAAPGNAAVLDVGTGSGCLAVTLAAERPLLSVEAWDVSPEALMYARGNAERHGARVNFVERDVLEIASRDSSWDTAAVTTAPERNPTWHMIVSNPPYIHESERATLHTSVLDHEPGVALFAGGDALIFYRALTELGRSRLRPGGRLMVEIHADRGAAVVALFEHAGFMDIQCLQDPFGRDRIVEGTWN